MRKRIFDLVEPPQGEERADLYDIIMLIAIIFSIVPLAFKGTNVIFMIIDRVTVVLFIIDYLLRWMTADLKLKRGAISFVAYPFSFLAIIDLLSILPGITSLNNGFRLLRVVRLIRMFRIFRVFKALRYSKSVELIVRVFLRQRDSLIAVCWISIGYVLISALLIFNVEPETFGNFFDSVYWATVSLTTVGYGDIYPASVVGRIVSMISSFFGIAVVAMPAGILTAGLMEELQKKEGSSHE